MTVIDAARGRRTIRKFHQKAIALPTLRKFVDAARLAPSGGNLQPLKYRIVHTREECAKIFPHVHFARYLQGAYTPKEGEEPTAYIIVCADLSIQKQGYEADAGAAVENIMLCAWEMGIGTCWMGVIDRPEIARILGIDTSRYAIHTLVALGWRGENPKTVPLEEGGDVKYWLDEKHTMTVPKRKLDDILL